MVETKTKKTIRDTVGTPEPTEEHEPRRTPLLYYDSDGFRSSLSLRENWNEVEGCYDDPIPQFYVKSPKGYIDIPRSSTFLKTFGRYLQGVGEAIEGVRFGNTDIDPEDVMNAHEKLQRFRSG